MNKIIKKWIIHPIKRRVAKYYLFFLRRVTGLKVIGITGSAGKTTTKEMLASILKLNGKTVYTVANIDPVYNIPTTILKCTPRTKYLILEMGVEYPGEMDFYLWLAKPDVGVITNIYPTHTEFFGDIEGVLKEKSKLVKFLDKSGFAVLNKTNSRLKSLINKIEAKIIWFNGENSDAAKAVANIFGVSAENIEKGLKNYDKPRHRYEIIKHKSGAVIFDDSYNSNPEALLTTLKKFNQLAGKNKKIAVLGDMLELGKLEKSEHIRIGIEVKKYNFEKVFGVGKSVKYITSKIYNNALDVLPELRPMLKKDVYVLIKGSRSIGLDQVVDKLV
ncbi:MAG: Mur ligase family protein [Candidatus Woesebacteria bacterium]|nr:Mur ligase family protein [Candidatus Woesebacteria bacterium]